MSEALETQDEFAARYRGKKYRIEDLPIAPPEYVWESVMTQWERKLGPIRVKIDYGPPPKGFCICFFGYKSNEDRASEV